MYTLLADKNNSFLSSTTKTMSIYSSFSDLKLIKMDSETIGMIQQYLDKYVEEGILPSYLEMWARIKKSGSIESEKSALIGQLYGGVLRFLSNLKGYEEDSINPYDLKELNEFFTSRLSGLERQIEQALTSHK